MQGSPIDSGSQRPVLSLQRSPAPQPVARQLGAHEPPSTQIVDGEGRVLARRSTREGPGVVSAEVLLQPGKATLEPDPSRFWIPKLPLFMRWYWTHQNACGKWYYRTRGAGASR